MLTPEIQAAVARLDRGSEGIDAVLNNMDDNNPNRFSRALSDLAKLAETEGISLAIVGGLAAIHYGHAVATQDIGIAVGKSHLEQFVRVAPSFGFRVAWESEKGWHTITKGLSLIHI